MGLMLLIVLLLLVSSAWPGSGLSYNQGQSAYVSPWLAGLGIV